MPVFSVGERLMKPDMTVGDLLHNIWVAPRKLLQVRLSTIGAILKATGGVALYVALVIAAGVWFHLPGYFYALALLIIPLHHLNEWWKERKTK